MVSRHLKDWDLKLAHAEFAYNRSPSTTTGHCPFEVVYGVNPLTPIDLTSLPTDFQVPKDVNEKIKMMKKFHEEIKKQIEKANEAYKRRANKHRKPLIFQPGDLVWLHLRKERFPSKRRSKIAPRADGPFEIIARVGDNAYKVALPDELGGVSATFNVGDLSPYLEDENLPNLRANSFQHGEDDMNQENHKTLAIESVNPKNLAIHILPNPAQNWSINTSINPAQTHLNTTNQFGPILNSSYHQMAQAQFHGPSYPFGLTMLIMLEGNGV